MGDEAMRDRGEEEETGATKRKDAGATKKVAFFGMFRYATRADLALMGVGTVAAMVNGMSEPLMTVVFAAVIESFGGSDNSAVLHRVSKVVMYYIYLGIGTALASFLQVSCWTMAGERQSARLRSLYLEAVLKQDVSFFDVEMTTGEAISRMSADTVLVQDALGEKVGKYAQLLTTFVGGFVIGFVRGWTLALVMLACIPPSILSFATVSRLRAQISARRQASYDDAGNVVEQSIRAIRTVVSFNGEKKAVALYNALIKKAYKATVLEGLVTGLGIGCIFCVVFCSYSLAFWYGAKLIISKGYTGGQVINVVFAILTGSMAIGNASPSISAIAEGQSAAHRLFEIINRKPKIDISDTSGIVLDDIKGDVELNNVFFRYPARPEQLILNGLSLQVPSGTTMAIVGESGSGKSTLISLVERFYDPQAGEVLIDGINIKNLKLQWIRGKISLVSQEPLLFMTSIKDNITYGKEDATLEEIKRAAELANAANFIEKLPNAYETMVGQSGAQLSGGQKQRIAIARAILKNPKVLLLDEATSALDVESERVVQEALNRIMVGITTLIVAHRLSTVRNADCITVVHQGKVVEQGAHDQLIKDPDGAYCQLIKLQQVHTEGMHEVPYASDSRLKSRSLSLEQSMRDSPRNRRQHSVKPLGLSGSDDLQGPANTSSQEHKEFGDSEAPQKAPIGRLFNLNKPEAPILLLAVIAAFVHGLLFPLFSIMMSGGIRTFYYPAHQLRKDSRFWALLCLLLAIISLIAIQLEFFLFGMAGGKLVERVRALSFQSIMHQEVAWFDDPSNSSGALGARLFIDALNIRRLVGDNLAILVQCTITLISGFAIAFASDWKLTLIVICVIPFLGLQNYIQVKFLNSFSEDAKVMYEDASQVVAEAVGSIRTVASFCAEKRVITMYSKKCQATMKQGIRSGMVGGLGFSFSNLMLYLTYALCFYVGAQFVHDGKSTFKDVFRVRCTHLTCEVFLFSDLTNRPGCLQVYFALVFTAFGISQTSAMASDSTKAQESTTSILAVIDRRSKIDPTSDEGIKLEKVDGNIDFNHVSFKYPSRPDVQVFSDFTLGIPSGKTTALVGESGSGKSTVIALLERFYDPDSGTISLDGTELKNLTLSWLRDQMGLVSQEPVLFNDTIRANIAYGKRGEATEEEIITVAKAANAHEFISSLPQGYNTNVGERGTQLSGGQKQRVAIARAILKDPRVLLLDEATSALDAESERSVQDALDKVMVSRTTIVVAHRLSTIKGADTIAVIKDGSVAEKGKHESLMGIKGGVYASLVELHSKASAS
ncbi:ABC transporter B family member 5-like isoform X1 [Triticum dicoccoides]|uniref:ABC transporter B family member 5-like isoform X1 n=1 Tax=Triticum dicoccoides TaxID=85692 RepID=UPI0008452F2B|nr:ABC transporter B family member 5-like isoform X1 [Triticum dicoccoides]XP_044349642.1 ABC transporter B family member 5-like isoform X1 [Triticum aestivum]